ncbi:MAG: hypothetical protein R2741_03440 [Methanolobus sp.]
MVVGIKEIIQEVQDKSAAVNATAEGLLDYTEKLTVAFGEMRGDVSEISAGADSQSSKIVEITGAMNDMTLCSPGYC